MKKIKTEITFRNIEPTQALKEYVNEKIQVLKKYIHQDTDAKVVLNVEKNRQIAEIYFHSDGADFKSTEETIDMYKSIDQMIDVVARQVKKHKEKLTSH